MRRGAIVLLLMALTSCTTVPSPPEQEPPEFSPPVVEDWTTPQSTIVNWAFAYRVKDLAHYASLLDSTYRFVIEGPAGARELELTRDEDIAYTAELFACLDEMDLNVASDEPVPSDVPGFPADEGYVRVPVTDIAARIQTRIGPAGDPLIHLIAGGPITIVVREDADTGVWRIVYMDVPAEYGAAWRLLKLAEACDAP